MKNNLQPTPIIKTLKLLHAAMVMGSFSAGSILYYIGKDVSPNKTFDSIIYPIIAICFILIFLGNIFFNKKLEEIRSLDGLENKMNKFKSTFILRLALMEAPALILFMLGFISKNQTLFLYGFTIVALMLFAAPTKDKIVSLLQLNNQEERELE